MNRFRMTLVALKLALGTTIAPPSFAADIVVTVRGSVEYNQVSSGPLAALQSGDPAELSFVVDSDVFTDSASFPVRGYAVDPSSHSFIVGSTTIDLPTSPSPAYFSIRNDDPGVDGFLFTEAIDFPSGVALGAVGAFGNFRNNFYVTYEGTTLPSFDILDATGFYEYGGLTVFNWTIDDGPAMPIGLEFESLEISEIVIDFLVRRGDANDDGGVDIGDAIFTLASLFVVGSPEAPCSDAADSNDDGNLDISDAIFSLSFLFTVGAPPPPAPGPIDCGFDPTDDALDCLAGSTCP